MCLHNGHVESGPQKNRHMSPTKFSFPLDHNLSVCHLPSVACSLSPWGLKFLQLFLLPLITPTSWPHLHLPPYWWECLLHMREARKGSGGDEGRLCRPFCGSFLYLSTSQLSNLKVDDSWISVSISDVVPFNAISLSIPSFLFPIHIFDWDIINI